MPKPPCSQVTRRLVNDCGRRLDPQNNLTAWQAHDRFLSSCEADPKKLPRRSERFGVKEICEVGLSLLEAVPPEAGKGAGLRAAIAAFLLIRIDPVQNPMYRKKAFKAAFRLAGQPQVPPSASAVDHYFIAVAFLDKIIDASKEDDLPIASRP